MNLDQAIVSKLNALPNYKDKSRVKKDVMALVSEISSLVPQVGQVYSNDGSEQRLLQLQGTIPIFYLANQYNIPADYYIPINYPEVPPQIYVRPMANMVIKKDHRHVGSDGMVYLPYLHSWGNRSDLLQLTHIMCSIFSDQPPLFATGPSPSQRTSSATVVNIGSSGTSNIPVAATASPVNMNGIAYGTPVDVQGRPYNSQSNITTVQVNTPIVSSSSASNNNTNNNINNNQIHLERQNSDQFNQSLKDVERQSLVEAVNERLRSAMYDYYERIHTELSEELKLNKELEQKRDILAAQRMEAEELKIQCSAGQIKLAELDKALDKWIAEQTENKDENTSTWKSMEEQALERIEPMDSLSSQYVQVQAEHNAIEDVLYLLEKALANQNNTTVDLSTFLKEQLRLSRSLFEQKTFLKKIKSVRERRLQSL